MVALAATGLVCWCIVLYCSAPYMPAPLIAGNELPAFVSSGAAEEGTPADAETGRPPAAGTIAKTSFGLGGSEVSLLLTIIASWPRRSMMYLKNSYVDQQMAVAGMEYNTRGNIPLKKPLSPAVSLIWNAKGIWWLRIRRGHEGMPEFQ